MAKETSLDLLALTADIVAAHVAHNSVHTGDVAKLISSVHGALAGLDAPAEASPAEDEYKPAVSARKSLASDDHITSMIDGKAYKTLRRHIGRHGLTDEEYRARYNLPVDYPMVSRAYSATRSAMARAIGLGRTAGEKVEQATGAASAAVVEAAVPEGEKIKRAMKMAATTVEPASTSPKKRDRKPAV